MPKKNGSPINRSKLIRDIKANNPSFKPKAIAHILKEVHGLDINPNYISTIISQAKMKEIAGEGTRRRGRPRKSAAASEGSKSRRLDEQSLELLMKAKEFAREMGGIEAAKRALDTLAELLG